MRRQTEITTNLAYNIHTNTHSLSFTRTRACTHTHARSYYFMKDLSRSYQHIQIRFSCIFPSADPARKSLIQRRCLKNVMNLPPHLPLSLSPSRDARHRDRPAPTEAPRPPSALSPATRGPSASPRSSGANKGT